MLTLTIHNDVSEMAALEPFVEQISEEYGLDMAFSFQLQLSLDEAVSNVVNYAYGEQKGMPITIEAQEATVGDRRQLELRLIDNGVEFNPLSEAPEVDVTLSAEDRQVGGLGIFLIRQVMDEVSYERKSDQNLLTMIKYL